MQQAAGWSEFLCYLKARLQFDIELRTGLTRAVAAGDTRQSRQNSLPSGSAITR